MTGFFNPAKTANSRLGAVLEALEHDLRPRLVARQAGDPLHEVGHAARDERHHLALDRVEGVVEVEEIVETGAMHPDSVHLPGIYVHRIVLNAKPEKRIEKRTITEKAGV
mgnify:CR=1 FL=1